MGCRPVDCILCYLMTERAKMVSFILPGVKGDKWGCEWSQLQSKIVPWLSRAPCNLLSSPISSWTLDLTAKLEREGSISTSCSYTRIPYSHFVAQQKTPKAFQGSDHWLFLNANMEKVVFIKVKNLFCVKKKKKENDTIPGAKSDWKFSVILPFPAAEILKLLVKALINHTTLKICATVSNKINTGQCSQTIPEYWMCYYNN